MNSFSPSIEQQVKVKALSYLKVGRPSDEEHTLRAVEFAKIILTKEGGNPSVVIPALYLHDVGWSRVNFADFISSPTRAKKDAISLSLHMKHGAEIAFEILRGINYDRRAMEKIVSIIAVHDEPRKMLAIEDMDATIVFEADYLDKFGSGGEQRILQIFGTQQQNSITNYLENYKSILFRTKTAKELLARIEEK